MKGKTKLEHIADSIREHNPKAVLDIGYAQEPNQHLIVEGRSV
jgi:hypothetical protein